MPYVPKEYEYCCKSTSALCTGYRPVAVPCAPASFAHRYMTTTCPELQGELLQVVAQLGPSASGNPALTTMAGGPGAVAGGGAGALVHRPHGLGPRVREAHREDDERRVRPRRE
jgi:hypothetical protein